MTPTKTRDELAHEFAMAPLGEAQRAAFEAMSENGASECFKEAIAAGAGFKAGWDACYAYANSLLKNFGGNVQDLDNFNQAIEERDSLKREVESMAEENLRLRMALGADHARALELIEEADAIARERDK
jgi:hypothetical protein